MKNENRIKSAEAVEYGFNKVFLGLFAVIYGLAFLVNQLGLFALNIDFGLIWPLFVVFVGLSLLRKRDVVSTSFGSTVATLCLAAVFISFMSPAPISYSQEANAVFPINITKEAGVEKADITINAGAGDISIYGISSGSLVKGEVQTNLSEVKAESKVKDSVQSVTVGMSGMRKWFGKNNPTNQFYVGIDNETPLSLNINSGASNNNIDLSGIRAEYVSLSTGASNVNLTMGDKLDKATVAIEAGASSISLNLPKDVGAKIFIESGMSSQDLTGFVQADKNTYQSPNYGTAEKKIDVSVSMGMASLSVNWYEPESKEIKESVLLYYYNKAEDKEGTHEYKFIKPVERSIPVGGDKIKSTVESLLKGGLTEQEKAQGFVTEYPNPDFKLVSSNLSDKGNLTLQFTEVPGFTSGTSPQVGIIMEEILKTVRQFPEVKTIVFKPDTLFEP